MCDTRPRGKKRPETRDSLNLSSEVAVFDDGFNAGQSLFIRLYRTKRPSPKLLLARRRTDRLNVNDRFCQISQLLIS